MSRAVASLRSSPVSFHLVILLTHTFVSEHENVAFVKNIFYREARPDDLIFGKFNLYCLAARYLIVGYVVCFCTLDDGFK